MATTGIQVASGNEAPIERIGRQLPPLQSGDRQELVFRGSLALLVVVTVAVVAVPAIHGHVVAPAIDLVLDTIATIVSLSVAVLAWVRFSEQREPHAIYRAGGFLALAVAYGTAVAVSLGRDAEPTTLGVPNTIQTYVFLAAWILSAATLLLGGLAATRRAVVRRPRLVLLAPGLVIVLAIVIGYSASWPPLPVLVIIEPDPSGTALPVITPLGVVVQAITAAMFIAAALVSRALWRRDRRIGDAWIASGLLFAAFAELHWAMYPSGHPGQVSTADLLWLSFFMALLLGIEAEARAMLARLKLTNVELAELREAEVGRAALEERARLARELHDGLAQDLWLAKLKTGQLSALPNLPPDAVPLVAEARSAIDSGLDEARQAVAALHSSSHSNEGFCSLIRQAVEDFGDRFGLRAEFAFEGAHTNRVAPRTQAEVLRIAQEALANVARHADATVAGVRLSIRNDRISLRVVDNGRGFDVAAVGQSFGLVSMRERAALIGGRLRVVSRVGAGTRIILRAPFAHPAAPGEGDHQ